MVDQGGEQDKVLAPHVGQFFSPAEKSDKTTTLNQFINRWRSTQSTVVVKAKLRYRYNACLNKYIIVILLLTSNGLSALGTSLGSADPVHPKVGI